MAQVLAERRLEEVGREGVLGSGGNAIHPQAGKAPMWSSPCLLLPVLSPVNVLSLQDPSEGNPMASHCPKQIQTPERGVQGLTAGLPLPFPIPCSAPPSMD